MLEVRLPLVSLLLGLAWRLNFAKLPPPQNVLLQGTHKKCEELNTKKKLIIFFQGQRLGHAWPRLHDTAHAESLASLLLQVSPPQCHRK